MKRVWLFTMVTAVSLVGLVTFFVIIYTSASSIPQHPDWMANMMRRMMGERIGETPMQPALPSYALLIPIIFTASAVAGVVGLTYSLTYPEIRVVKGKEAVITPSAQRAPEGSAQAVMKTLKPEEVKVLEILMMHGGRHLQKYVSKEAGLSRLKTHRIIARFAERGIVTVREHGNTNEVTLADWLRRETKEDG